MYTAEESKKVRQKFWTSFGKEYPHKWLLYNTKMKEIQLKFSYTTSFAMVSLDIIDHDEFIRSYYFEKLESLKTILHESYLPEVEFDKEYQLPEGKVVSRIFVICNNVNIHREKDWPFVKEFFYDKMQKLEEFFMDFSDFLKS